MMCWKLTCNYALMALKFCMAWPFLGMLGYCCFTNAAYAEISKVDKSTISSSASQTAHIDALEHQVQLLESRLEKLREVEVANAGPAPFWGWLLGFSLCFAMLCVVWMLWLLHRLQEQERRKKLSSKAVAKQDTPAENAHADLLAVFSSDAHANLTPTFATARSPEHNPFSEDPDDLHVIEFEDKTLSDDEYDFSIGLDQRATRGAPSLNHLAPLTSPQKHLAEADLMEDDLLFVSKVSSSENFLQVEEISDGLQEAKFWAALQKLDHAIAILEEEIKQAQVHTPASWLYLLDLYGQVGDKEKYQLLRERFHRFFNGKIPAWQEPKPENKPCLADFPHITEKLAHISHTEQAIQYLESLLLDDRDGTREGFAYGVYCDIVQLLDNFKKGRHAMHFN